MPKKKVQPVVKELSMRERLTYVRDDLFRMSSDYKYGEHQDINRIREAFCERIMRGDAAEAIRWDTERVVKKEETARIVSRLLDLMTFVTGQVDGDPQIVGLDWDLSNDVEVVILQLEQEADEIQRRVLELRQWKPSSSCPITNAIRAYQSEAQCEMVLKLRGAIVFLRKGLKETEAQAAPITI